MTERELALVREARAFEKVIRADPHNRHPARGNDMAQLRRRARRRTANRRYRNLLREGRW